MQLAQSQPNLNIIGLGALDSLEEANQFVEFTGAQADGLTMVWDPSSTSRQLFGVRAQPYWLLYDAQGIEVTSRPGSVDPDLIASLLS